MDFTGDTTRIDLALGLGPPADATLADLASLLVWGRFAEAEELCRAARAAGRPELEWRLGLAWALLYQGRGGAALQAADEAVVRAPGRSEPLLARGFAALLQGDRDQASAAAAAARHSAGTHRAYPALLRSLEPGASLALPRPTVALDLASWAELRPTLFILRSLEEEMWADPAGPPPGPALAPAPAPAPPAPSAVAAATTAAADAAAAGDPSAAARRSGRAHIDQQMAALLGASVFGPWAASERPPAGTRRRARRRTWRGALAAAAVACGAVALALVVNASLVHVRQERATKAVRSLREFLLIGDLVRASRLVVPEAALADDDHRHVVARAEATLYRFHDAAPARRARAARLLADHPATGYDAVVARALLLPRAERASRLAELRALDRPGQRDPCAALLVAIALAPRHDEAAAAAFDRALLLGPDHAPLLSAAAEFEHRRGRGQRAVGHLEALVETNPRSPWVALTRARLAQPAAPPPDTPPVIAGELALLEAAAEQGQGRPARAAVALERAAAAVHHEPSFLLDYLDQLLERRQPELARRLSELAGWPPGSPAAHAAAARLAAPGSAAPPATGPATPVPAVGTGTSPAAATVAPRPPEERPRIGGRPHPPQHGRRTRPARRGTR
ncbi:MAG: hypothetical protein MUC69_00285 [Gemmatimonadales bacterium]|nr:hypothetical protein [Gemmatimonadales bacterium]